MSIRASVTYQDAINSLAEFSIMVTLHEPEGGDRAPSIPSAAFVVSDMFGMPHTQETVDKVYADVQTAVQRILTEKLSAIIDGLSNSVPAGATVN